MNGKRTGEKEVNGNGKRSGREKWSEWEEREHSLWKKSSSRLFCLYFAWLCLRDRWAIVLGDGISSFVLLAWHGRRCHWTTAETDRHSQFKNVLSLQLLSQLLNYETSQPPFTLKGINWIVKWKTKDRVLIHDMTFGGGHTLDAGHKLYEHPLETNSHLQRTILMREHLVIGCLKVEFLALGNTNLLNNLTSKHSELFSNSFLC